MALSVEIDSNSGFCGGVIRAIRRAEDFLDSEGPTLYSLGSIVHNEAELERLHEKGLERVATVEEMTMHPGQTLFIRAHGEPPQTYLRAAELGLKVIDCTCPVVLRLQESIREAYSRVKEKGGQVVIFGKVGHAEVLGLVGQTDGEAVVVENLGMLRSALDSGQIRLEGPLEVFSQTTKSPSGYGEICSELLSRMAESHSMPEEEFSSKGLLSIHDTICRQVASRHEQLSSFARNHDVVVFVAGRESSNGKVLFDLCRKVNERTYLVGGEDEISPLWFRDGDKVGVCGATSTPKWLLVGVENKIMSLSREG